MLARDICIRGEIGHQTMDLGRCRIHADPSKCAIGELGNIGKSERKTTEIICRVSLLFHVTRILRITLVTSGTPKTKCKHVELQL